ncbi:transcription factor RelB homolog isoform X2 [Sphaeramia orbicularis]|uniref:transcription factor RelB homolog isoform X2 n=1 Tax=Sphaeramia orbicularis TaxID=375764 RepID=UPI00117DED98|nr:transcription factor RelB homolog isoform X2 [Sphaeramia orbicularis]
MKDMDIYDSQEQPLTDFELVEEVLRQDDMWTVDPLPGPPRPPASFLVENHSPNHRMSRQTSSPPSQQPVLVPRGTGCTPSYNFHNTPPLQPSCSSREMSSTPSSRESSSRHGRGSLTSKSSAVCIQSSQNLSSAEMLERVLEKPTLVVVEEPKDRGMRFRYECEGRSAGSILGASSTDTNKTQPTIEIQGPIDHIKKIAVTVSLVTKDLPHRPHPHCLVGKDCPNGSGICVVSLNPHNNRRHSFSNLGIQCVRRKELDASLQKRRSQNIDPFKTGHSKGIEDMDMNAVRLCFESELEWEDGKKDSLYPVVSKPIYDKKATTTSQLKITRLNLDRGSCIGKTEVYMLCDKVQKDDIEIVFRRDSWKANGEFAQTDVHRQVGIVFKTPPYQDQSLTEEVEVSLCLRRISDQMESEPVTFTYLPHNPDPYEVRRKRKIKSDRENPCATEESVAAPESSFHFPQTQLGSDDMSLLTQLLETPALMEIFSDTNIISAMSSGFDQGPDANATFMDMNFNQNPGQDFTQYSDLQFNRLVTENWSSEPQDGSFNMVQVKKEDDDHDL